MRTDRSVLVLDSHWRVTNATTPQVALTDMAKGTMTAVLIHGKDHFEPLDWEGWLALEVKDGEEFVATTSRKVKMPTVVIAVNFKRAKTILRAPKVRPSEVRKAYGGVCAYTGEHVGVDGSVDHVLPRSRGGQNTWENVVWSSAKVNAKKGALTPEEAGLRLVVPIKKPKAKPLGAHVELRADRPEWLAFVN